MKFLVTMLVCGFIGYLVYNIQQAHDAAPTPLITLSHHTANEPDPTPTPEPTVYVPKPPDMTEIPVRDGETLTHAKVKELRTKTIVFLCDQGIFEVGFDRLPPQFAQYYGPIIATQPASTPDAAGTVSAPPTKPPAKEKPQRSAVDDASARASFFSSKESLENRLKSDQETIDKWYRQSSFEPGGISEAQFNSAKADFDYTTSQLSQLIANGP
jgi:hypothetical protein